jgi:gluconokinase
MVAEDQPSMADDFRGYRLGGGAQPLAVVVMGVSGCGKSTVGKVLAEHLGVGFVDADDLHSSEAKDKMAAGTALGDEDRWPWLRRVGDVISAETGTGRSTVVACSALRRVYRDLLRQIAGDMIFVHLHGTRQLLEERLRLREGHFMPTALLGSQLAALEPLERDERGILLDMALPSQKAVDQVLEAIVRSTGAGVLDAQSSDEGAIAAPTSASVHGAASADFSAWRPLFGPAARRAAPTQDGLVHDEGHLD